MPITWSITNQENDPWSPAFGPTINPTNPTYFNGQPTPNGLLVVCAGPKFAGALMKNSAPLWRQSTQFRAFCTIQFDQTALSNGQVFEIDRKFTDAAGYTYDGSFQINLAEGGKAQYSNPWKDFGGAAQITLTPNTPITLEVDYTLDYNAHTIVVTFNGVSTPAMNASKSGWAPNEIITQLQLCTNAQGGFYSCLYKNIGITGN